MGARPLAGTTDPIPPRREIVWDGNSRRWRQNITHMLSQERMLGRVSVRYPADFSTSTSNVQRPPSTHHHHNPTTKSTTPPHKWPPLTRFCPPRHQQDLPPPPPRFSRSDLPLQPLSRSSLPNSLSTRVERPFVIRATQTVIISCLPFRPSTMEVFITALRSPLASSSPATRPASSSPHDVIRKPPPSRLPLVTTTRFCVRQITTSTLTTHPFRHTQCARPSSTGCFPTSHGLSFHPSGTPRS